MKLLSLLFLLGAAVLLFFLQPWGALERILDNTGTRQVAPAKPSTAAEPTAAVGTTRPRPPEAAALPPAATAEPPEAIDPKAADPKPNLLANEKAEAERNAALEQKAATPAPPETKRYFKVTVRDSATLEAGLLPTDRVVIRLQGITAQSPDDTCKTESDKTWPCGAEARAALIQLIRYRAVT